VAKKTMNMAGEHCMLFIATLFLVFSLIRSQGKPK